MQVSGVIGDVSLVIPSGGGLSWPEFRHFHSHTLSNSKPFLSGAFFRAIWSERKQRIFEDVKVGEVWEKVNYRAALWASVSPDFRNTSILDIVLDWKAVVS